MLYEVTEELAVFLMDNCSSHVTEDVIDFLTEARHSVMNFAPHTPQIFQVLDATLFGVLKRHLRYELLFGDEMATIQFITRVSHDFEQTIVDPDI
jgi:hypothetical protein